MASAINFLLLVELIVIVIVASAFLFYWNRLLASVLAFFIRLYTWRSYSAYISIGSLQVSPLAGRISFRDIEYHSSNLSFRALHGHITWRYWKIRVRQEGDSQSTNPKRNRLPCRINIYAEGVEGFVFNRTPAYDAIVERMKKHEKESNSESSQESLAKSKTNGSASANGHTDANGSGFGARLRKVAKSTTSTQPGRPSGDSEDSTRKPSFNPHELPLQPKPVKTPSHVGVNWFREILPVEIHIVSGSLILGSDATPQVLIGDFKRVDGTLEITDSRSLCDEYKLSVELKFEDPKVLMRTNVDYSGPLLAHGKKAYDELYKQEPEIAKQPPSTLSSFFGFRAFSTRFHFLRDPKFSSPPVAGLPHDRMWKGLARYRMTDENIPKAPRREDREYAKVTTLVEAPAIDLTYYADTPVPSPSSAGLIDDADEFGNVEPSPEYGIDIVIHGGTVKYGPWADRQRDALQRTFAPSIFFDSEPKPRLEPGDLRIHSALVVNLQLEEETILRIPTREASKDWIYDNSNTEVERRYGWLDITVGPNSSINYTQSQFATKRGYDAILVLHLDSLEIASSVNLETFIRSKACKLSMTMPTPLRWDARRDWGLDITLDTPDITLLRDHVQLISDLARDWSSGQAGDFHHFVPNHYNFRVALLNYAFHLYINDFNIVDEPRSRDRNAFMDIYGPRLESYIAVSATQYRPDLSTVPFTVNAKDARVELSVPVWDTHRSFGADPSIEVGKIGEVTASGTYTFYSEPHPEHQETLQLHLEGRRVVYKALGWVLRRMFCVKDNYFGGFTQFTTMQEYLERFDHDPDSVGDPVEEKYRPGRSDPYAVNITMNVEESLILMTDQIYGCERGLAMPVPQLQMVLKSVEQFMELSLDALPTYVVPIEDMAQIYRLGVAPPIQLREALFVEGIELKANRLFGPQPRATTYLCLWEFVSPRITAFLSPQFITTLKSTVEAVAYTFVDVDNSPATIYIPKTPPDVTFFKLGIDNISATLFAGDSAVTLDLPEGVNLDTSTLATRSFKSAIGLIIPSITMNLLQRDSHERKWLSAGIINSNLSLDIFNAPKGWHEKASEQQRFLRQEDEPTQRIWYMYSEKGDQGTGLHVRSLFLPRPMVKDPVLDAEVWDDSIMDATPPDVDLSSPDSSDVERADETRRIRLRRRSRSFATARETVHNSSIGDESDSVSEVSSSAASSASIRSDRVEHDMASALAERLSHFRSAQDQVPSSSEWVGDESDEKDDPFSRPMSDGKVIRLTMSRVDVELELKSAKCASDIAVAMTKIFLSDECRLDELQIAQADSVLDEVVEKDPTVIDLHAPALRVRISTIIAPTRTHYVDARMQGVRGNVLLSPITQDGPSLVDIGITSRSIDLSISSNKLDKGFVSLLDIEKFQAYPNSTTPVVLVKLTGLQVGFQRFHDEMQVRGKAALADVDFVTASAAHVLSLYQTWEQTLESEMKAPRSDSFSTAKLLSRIIDHAAAADATTIYPFFVYEGAYGLHVDDQRNIRRDPGWMMVSRLRHWMRSDQISSNDDHNIPDQELTQYLVSYLAKLDEAMDGNEHLVANQAFVKKALGSASTSQQSPQGQKSRKTFGTFFNLGDVSLCHHGRALGSSVIATSAISMASSALGFQQSSFWQDEREVKHYRILTAIRTLHTDFQDSVLPAIETILSISGNDSRIKKPSEVETQQSPPSIMVLDFQLQELQFSILAGGLRIRLGVHNVQHSIAQRRASKTDSGHDGLRTSTRANVTLCSDSIDLSLLQPVDEYDLISNSPDRIVAFVKLEGVRSVIDHYCPGHKDKAPSCRVIFGVRAVDFDSRPQMRAFLAFARAWQKENLGSKYKSMIDQIRKLALSRRRYAVETINVGGTMAQQDLNLDLSIGSVQLQVRAAKAVWIRWEIGKIFITRYGSSSNVQFGVHVAPQMVGAYTSMKRTKTKDASTIRLPSLTAIGFHRTKAGKPHISATVSLGFFVGILKPAVLDRLLNLHQRLGTDIMHIVQEYHETVQREISSRQAKFAAAMPAEPVDHSKSSPKQAVPVNMLIDLRLSVSGVRFGLRADDVATTLLFEALSLRGHVTNSDTEDAALLWRAKVDHFGLSLGHLGNTVISDDAEPMRKHRSAYMMLDIDVQEIPGRGGNASQLNVSLNRVHTVMHVAALSELSDLIRSWHSDIHILREHRATEVAEVKTTTTKLLKRLEANERPMQPEASWFANRLFSVEMIGFGIAVPLDEGAAIDLSQRENSNVPALLFSIRVVSFQNKRNETARFKIQQMGLQFLDKFDQGAPEHFKGDYHPSTSRMLLPSLDTQAQMSSTAGTWSLSAHCSATDFKLSLAPDVIDGVFQLIDLYEHGKDRLVELEKHYRAEMAKRDILDSVSVKYDGDASPTSTRHAQRILIRMSYTFNSGIVEMHRTPTDFGPQTNTPSNRPGRAAWHDTFTLPTISVWMDYAGPSVDGQTEEDGGEHGILVFNAAVHESRNTLRPSILPFFVEVLNRVERRGQTRRRTHARAAERKADLMTAAVNETTLQVISPSAGSHIRLRVTLRIDRSELRLSCAPDSNAYVDLKWESGGFLASTILGADGVSTIAGSISGVTSSLSHEFAEKGRSCVEAGAKDMAFSVTFCPGEVSGQKGLSIVLDTQLSGQFRLDAFSAWLIFTSVWVDNAPKLDIPLRAAIPEAASTVSLADAASTPAHQSEILEPHHIRYKLGVAALMRFRVIDFDANVAVSRAKLEISPVILRTISNGEKTQVDVQIGTTQITARGDISGDLRSEHLTFNTSRKSSRATANSDPSVLSMSIDAGDLSGNMFLGDINILRFLLEPAVVTLADDWKNYTDDAESQVSLAFAVRAGQFQGVLRLLAIPRLLGNLYSVLDMVDSQQRIAMQRSEIFKANRVRKSTEPSPVAAVILQTARRASATSTSLHVKTAQTMQFDLAGIDIGVFNEDYEAGGQVADFYRFMVGKVEAKLQRSSRDNIPIRELGLLVSLINWDNCDGAKAASKEKANMSARQLIDVAWRQGRTPVVSLPSMTLKMSSQELSNPSVLDFDFDIVWGETDGDIGIMPNFFEQAFLAFRKLLKGLDEQQIARMRRTDPTLSPRSHKKGKKDGAEKDEDASEQTEDLIYRPRDPKWADEVPIPKLKQLGESTGEAARLIPRIRSATREIPVLSHRFVTLPLEEGMDLLLKLYEKQLPERAPRDETHT